MTQQNCSVDTLVILEEDLQCLDDGVVAYGGDVWVPVWPSDSVRPQENAVWREEGLGVVCVKCETVPEEEEVADLALNPLAKRNGLLFENTIQALVALADGLLFKNIAKARVDAVDDALLGATEVVIGWNLCHFLCGTFVSASFTCYCFESNKQAPPYL